MYTVTIAARISSDSFASEFSNARAVPWKVGSMLAGMPRLRGRLPDMLDGRAQRSARRQVEGKRHHRELALMIDRDRSRDRARRA